MMDMQFGLAARQRHYERTAHAYGPRRESYGQVVSTPMRRIRVVWPRIAQTMRLPNAIHSLGRLVSASLAIASVRSVQTPGR
jgi:hypothetical protein